LEDLDEPNYGFVLTISSNKNIEGRGDGNDIERILDEVKKMKNELYRV
jgi:hypothetical protein